MAPKAPPPTLPITPAPDDAPPPTMEPENEAAPAPPPPKTDGKSAKPAKERDPETEIEEPRRCPLCWGRFRGYGIAYHTAGRKTYYRCSKALKGEPCGHTWVAQKPQVTG